MGELSSARYGGHRTERGSAGSLSQLAWKVNCLLFGSGFLNEATIPIWRVLDEAIRALYLPLKRE